MYDGREIFSEEDFCNPDYHKFRLPQFSLEHHETLLQTQNQKLLEQQEIFHNAYTVPVVVD